RRHRDVSRRSAAPGAAAPRTRRRAAPCGPSAARPSALPSAPSQPAHPAAARAPPATARGTPRRPATPPLGRRSAPRPSGPPGPPEMTQPPTVQRPTREPPPPNPRDPWRRERRSEMIVSSRDTPSTQEAPVMRPSPLVDRVDELTRLLGALDDTVRTREGLVVLVSGEAGIGKTRLLPHFVDEAVRAH